MSPHRLVPLTMSAVGRKTGVFSVVGSAFDADEALRLVAQHRPDVFVFDPTAVSLGRTARLLQAAGPCLPHPQSIALLLEPALAASAVAARFAWGLGVRCAMTSQDDPEFWPVAISSALRGAIFASPLATDLFGMLREVSSHVEYAPVDVSYRHPAGPKPSLLAHSAW